MVHGAGIDAAVESKSPALARLLSSSSGHAPRPRSKEGKVLHPDLLNDNLQKTQYAVRGELYNRAQQMSQQGVECIYTNIGNPQQLGQAPLDFNREVLSLLLSPPLLDNPRAPELFSAEAIDRARELLAAFGGRMGAYSDARGVPAIREQVAKFILQRDGHQANPDHIFLTDGASVGVKYALNALIRDDHDGVLCPIPQYPLYSAAIQLFGGRLVPYYLDEAADWGLDLAQLRKSLQEARRRGTVVRGLVFINPGNPTGQVLDRASIEGLIRLAHEEHLFLMADEVYQPNIYTEDKPFISARKVLMEMGAPYCHSVELASFHTVSKGMLGECGLRGGYVEWVNVHPGAMAELYKIASVNLCPNTVGQATVSLMVAPPRGTGPAAQHYWEQYNDSLASLKCALQRGWRGIGRGGGDVCRVRLCAHAERWCVWGGWKKREPLPRLPLTDRRARPPHRPRPCRRRATIMTDAFNGLEGVSCNKTEGAMYSFPRLHLPAKAVEAARDAGKDPDTFYCLALLAETGIVTVPGTGFGQEKGTFHLRTTILPQEDVIQEFVDKLRTFHTYVRRRRMRLEGGKEGRERLARAGLARAGLARLGTPQAGPGIRPYRRRGGARR